MRRRALPVLVAALGLALVLAACGARPDGGAGGAERDAAGEAVAPTAGQAADPGRSAAADPNEPVSDTPAADTKTADDQPPPADTQTTPAADPSDPDPEPVVVQPEPAPPTAPADPPAPKPDPPASDPEPPDSDPGPAAQPEGTVTFETIATGAYSGLRQQGGWLLRDAEAFQSIWQQHTAQVMPAPDAPQVDFSREAVVVVSLGERNTGGYSVRITNVAVSDGKLVVSVATTEPGPRDMVTMALTQPFHIVKIPLTGGSLELEVHGLPEGGQTGLTDR